MGEIETDYLVVGAGASGMAFVDALIAQADVDVVLVDRRHRPGGHWLDAYPFVRLHQPSATYGVNSRRLGADRIDDTGPNAGFYERATAADIVGYYSSVLDEHLVPSGRVRFLGMCDYQGGDADGHHVISRVTGEPTTVRVRRKLVDATNAESSIPATHTPPFAIDPGARVIPPNDLVHLAGGASGYTVIGAGKTAMDSCNWLLDQGVDPDLVQWIRPRDPWTQNRAFAQPLDLVGSYLQLQAHWVAAAAQSDTGHEFAHHLERVGVFDRLDPGSEADAYRGAILSTVELESLRRIERVVRKGRVLRVATGGVTLSEGSIASDPGQVFVDCTASGTRATVTRPVFEPGQVTLQLVTIGFATWSAATVGVVEASRDDDAEKNRLCPPLAFSGRISDVLALSHVGMTGLAMRSAEPDLQAWTEASRLNPACGAADRMDDPQVVSAMVSLGEHYGPAMSNLARLAALSD